MKATTKTIDTTGLFRNIYNILRKKKMISDILELLKYFFKTVLPVLLLKAINMLKAILTFLTEIAEILYAFDNSWKQKGM